MANQTDPYAQTTVGTATGSVGFFGAAGTTLQSVTGTVTTTISQVATSGKWAFATSTAAIALVQAVQDIKAALEAYGLTEEG